MQSLEDPVLKIVCFKHFWLFAAFFCRPSVKESSEMGKHIPKATSQGSFGVHSPYNRHSYTPTLSRSPQHFHRPGEYRTPQYSYLSLFITFMMALIPSVLTFSLSHHHFPYLHDSSSFHFLNGITSRADLFPLLILWQHLSHFPFMSPLCPSHQR